MAYGDFASPACAQTYETVKEIQKAMGARLRYVYRSFPQPEQFRHSEEAAEAAECASSQGDSGRCTTPFSKVTGRRTMHGSPGGRRRRAWTSFGSGARCAPVSTPEGSGSIREGGVRSGVASAPAFFINSVRHESSFGLATLLAAFQAASGSESTSPGESQVRHKAPRRIRRFPMLMTVAIVLLVLWALGLFAFHVSTGFIHVLIVLAVIALVMHLLRGNRLAA